MFGLMKFLLFGLWLIGLSQGRSNTAMDWHETPEPDPTIFENKSLFELELHLNDVDSN
ncbi:uncharacterized protein Dvir_GJ26274 [Drosophila virilis]|uniref:Uncharacterized protein n=1 Tax=Drosophila virilis TaxID=7244 RepID=A0A0Q9WGC1_DROVI|nr:uncharacterized protein Dvir_GJ26274 [Drosophila virilis]